MTQTLDRGYLNEIIKPDKNHSIGKVYEIVPFSSHNKEIKAIIEQFHVVLGEFIRNICEIKLDKKGIKDKDLFMSEEENELVEFIADQIEFENEDEKFDFIRFLDNYLFNQNEIKPLHPYLFNYLSTDKVSNHMVKFSEFMKDVFVQDHEEIKNIFNNKESDDILTELILSKLEPLKERKESEKKKKYEPLLPSLINLYQEDLLYLSKHKDYFLKTFSLLTHFYVFMYVCQLLVKFEQFTNTDMNCVQPLYFSLDWESLNKRRQAASEISGYKLIKEKASNFFPHIHTISQLSHVSFNNIEDEKKINFIPYSELYNTIKEQGETYEKQFLTELKQWIEDYKRIKRVDVTDDSTTIPEAFRVLFKCLKEGMSAGVCEKYGKNIEFLGVQQFIKARGSIGHVFNIKHDFLLLLTAISVKDHRIPLKNLFIEFEKRGVAFDRHSKKEIINLLDQLNILDKKSDSGDAQYVNPIL